MTATPVDFKSERDKRAARCEYCNEPAHATEWLCPRISAIVKPDGTEVRFWPADGEISGEYYLVDLSDDDDDPDGAA